ncbi:hypothetical protein L1D19_05940 [Vibrio natriegens]|uniref:hypothetical protein n=1 Tax=Vibrio natriegens TaxID=691 RepID=UPI001EFCC593|nr:hypothetical protein [Vibrio natriegens]MCG9699673.1 hypothetical protein [Vibrio natriegens]
MKAHQMPEITLDSIEKLSTNVSGAGLLLDIEFLSPHDYANAFEDMAEKISDDTLIDILKKRNPDYLSEDYR